MARVGTDWGLLTVVGTEAVKPTYPYMSYMGDGLYAVRGRGRGRRRSSTAMGRRSTARIPMPAASRPSATASPGTAQPRAISCSLNASGTLKKTVSGIETPEIVASTVRARAEGRPQPEYQYL